MISNCIIIGSQKAGTTSLFHYLGCQDGVFAPKIKECDFYSNYANSALQKNLQYNGKVDAGSDLGEYRKLYAKADGFPVRLDASPSYMWCDGVPEAICELSEDPLIVGIIREPLSRIKSAYKHNIRRGLEDLTDINEAVRLEEERWSRGDYKLTHLYVRRSEYLAQLKRFYTVLPSERIKIFTFEQLTSDPEAVVRSILDAYGLGLSNTECFKEAKNAGVGAFGLRSRLKSILGLGPKSVAVPVNSEFTNEVKAFIGAATEPYFDELSQLTGCALSNWKQ